MKQTYRITISGQVQGVGFRPFVYSLAIRFGLTGRVLNNENGVVILLNATAEKVAVFIAALHQNHPANAVLLAHEVEEIPDESYTDFQIETSQKSSPVNLPLTPDFALCDDCRKEISSSENRRFQYPFTTCTQCGPRYAISARFPFEREHTAMHTFSMCEQCAREYQQPANRRFHSQTNSCPTCGITLSMFRTGTGTLDLNSGEVLLLAAEQIKKGNIVGIKNTSGYLLCCDASQKQTVARLRERKKRPRKPFALLYPSIRHIQQDCHLTEEELAMLCSPIGPIVLLRAKPTSGGDALTREEIAPGLDELGVMLPSSALLQLLMNLLDRPVIATSGNLHGAPIIASRTEAEEKLSAVADYIVHHNLPVVFPQDDSVVKMVGNEQVVLRRARGLAPNMLGVEATVGEVVLAMGGHLKSTFTMVPNEHIYTSQYFGHLGEWEVSERLDQTIRKYLQLFGQTPETVLIDRHPGYQSSLSGQQWAKRWGAPLVTIQHHQAHFASVLGEHQLFSSSERILGVIWDGTGAGDDGAIWGGEFFVYQNRQMERLQHFTYFKWIAGDKMAREPRLSLLSLLPEGQRSSIKEKFTNTEWKIYQRLLKTSELQTSSIGRLFDAVACALGLIDINTYEGEAAILLENCASRAEVQEVATWLSPEDIQRLSGRMILNRLMVALARGVAKEVIAYSFIHQLAQMIIYMAVKNNIRIVAVSGGVFQNVLLLRCLMSLAEEAQIVVKKNCKLSGNDENISFGQLMYYQNIEKYVLGNTRKDQKYQYTI